MKSLVPSIHMALYPARTWIFLVAIVALVACSDKKDTSVNEMIDESQPLVEVASLPDDSFTEKKPLNVIVLPPYDEMAGAGISPDISKYLENALRKDDELEVMKFPYQKLINANYYMVYDKKFCRDIVELIGPDIIVMSRLELSKRTGNMNTDRWDFEVKVYDVTSDRQRKSISGQSLRAEAIHKTIDERREDIVGDILETRK